MTQAPPIEAVLALNGRIYAMLNEEEKEILRFYIAQGRKWGVSASIVNAADPEELARARSHADAEEIMRRANSRVSVVQS